MIKFLIFSSIFMSVYHNSYCQNSTTVLPSKSQLVWADCEIGVIIHLDINIFDPDNFDYKNSQTLPPLKCFKPSKLNTDQWIKAAKDAGANYALLTAKHCTGFALWPSHGNDYNVGNTPWKSGHGDIVRDFIASCKKYNIHPGIYYNTNFNTKYGAGYKPFSTALDQTRYYQMVLKQLTELWTDYGELFEIWFDGGIMKNKNGGIASEVDDLIARYQPHAILFQGPEHNKNLIRWVGNEDAQAPYPNWSTSDTTTSATGTVEILGLNGKPGGKIWCPGEADVPNIKQKGWNGGWLWKANQDSILFSARELIDRYYTSVGHNANMLIGMAIDTSGQFPENAAKIFAEFGANIRHRFEKPLAQINGSGRVITLHISNKPVIFNNIVIMEDIEKGERIRKYHLEARIDDKWKTIGEGSSVGHKRIHRINDVVADEIKLVVDRSIDEPQIRNISVYYVQVSK